MLLYWIFFSKWVALGLSLFRTFLCYWDSLILLLKDIYCILGNVRPRFNFASFAFIVSGRIKDWANSNVKNTPHLTQLCLGELKIAGWNRVKITLFTVSADFKFLWKSDQERKVWLWRDVNLWKFEIWETKISPKVYNNYVG